MNVHSIISSKINIVLKNLNIISKINIQISKKNKFGNYQINILPLSKKFNINTIKLANTIVNFIKNDSIFEKINIVEPGFINIFLAKEWLEKQLIKLIKLPRLGILKTNFKQTIIIDYSSPNIAKEMHVGHMRSTIVGDVSVRILEFLGHKVIKANHIGDWGTQFGMLIAYLEKINYKKNIRSLSVSNLNKFYNIAKLHFEKNINFAKYARSCVVKLQNNDFHYKNLWKNLVNITIRHNQKIYNKLNVKLTNNDIMGESLYNNMLSTVVLDLKVKKIAVESKGAIVVFLEEIKNEKNEPTCVIIQKQNGSYPYITIDIACIKYRYENFKANRIIYYIDSRQKLHLLQAWIIARKAKYIPDSVLLEHHMLGMILNNEKKPFKTREGNVIKLIDLIHEAINRANKLIIKKNNKITNKNELIKLSQIIGIGALKYSDLAKNRNTDYVFNWETILSFEGNTAPYIQYAYIRILSILKKRNNKYYHQFYLQTEQEIQLSICLLQLEEILILVAKNGMPNLLCSYLYKLSVLFSIFYENCPILVTKDKKLLYSRIQLSILTARTIKKGLNLLGIKVPNKM